jgi:pilus assembly protein CpaB
LFVRNWRFLTAIAAVVLAALAGVLVWKYTDNAEKDAKRPYQMESVLVAAKRVPAGTSFASAIDGELITRQARVRQSLPATAIPGEASDEQLKNTYKTLVASHDIIAGQTVVTEDFVGQGQVQSGISGQLQTDQAKENDAAKKADPPHEPTQLQAVTLTLDEKGSVGGFLNPGDTVNILVSLGQDRDKWDTAKSHVQFTSFLMQGIKVLAVGATTGTPTAQASGSSTPTTQATNLTNRNNITFEVTARQAEQLVHAHWLGTIHLTLNPPSFKAGDFRDVEEVVEQVNLFDKPLPLVDRETAKPRGAAAQG